MTIKEIVNTTEHRPWKMPTESWKFYQEWNNALFLHWLVELSELKKFVPNELEIDLFDGKPWVSVVAFTMEKIRPKNLPSFSPISDFDEINIRTYVKSNNKTGVYFLSIEGDKKGVVKDKNAILKAKENFLSKAFSLNWKLNYNSISKLVGKDGNEEEFFYFSKK